VHWLRKAWLKATDKRPDFLKADPTLASSSPFSIPFSKARRPLPLYFDKASAIRCTINATEITF
jgi:hypothetical protein